MDDKKTMPIELAGDNFCDALADEVSVCLFDAIKAKTDTFSIPYVGGDGTPMGAQTDMTCVVVCWPTPLAVMLAEGLQEVKAHLVAAVAANLAEAERQAKAKESRPPNPLLQAGK